MVGVQEVPRGSNPRVYFSSLYARKASSRAGGSSAGYGVSGSSGSIGGLGSEGTDSNGGSGTNAAPAPKRKRINYNQTALEEKAMGLVTDEPDEATTVAAEVKQANKRFDLLDKENYNDQVRIELPKTGFFKAPVIKQKKTNPSVTVKRLLVSRKTFTNYYDEIDKSQWNSLKLLESEPDTKQMKKLCTICGNISFSSCIKCGSRVCCVRCQTTHSETRCTF